MIWDTKKDDCIIVDPGTENNNELFKFLESNQLSVEAVILTHEHYDHIAGVNSLFERFSFSLICSRAAGLGIANSKSNFSIYKEEYETIEISKVDKIIDDGETSELLNKEIKFYETPGHSPGGICFNIGLNLFVGDTILNGTKVPLKLPGSNKAHYRNSVERLKKIFQLEMMIYPGHGDPFALELINLNQQ